MSAARTSVRIRVDDALVRRVILGVTIAATVVIVLAALAELTGTTIATGDNAPIEMRVRDVGSSDTPLIGPPSRYNFFYPGPLLYWLLAVPYRLLGGTSLAAAAGIVSAFVVPVVFLVARRSRSTEFTLLALLVLLVLARAHTDELISGWNPYVPIVWLFPFALLTWRIACGEIKYIPHAALLAAVLVQCHLQYTLVCAVLLVWSTVVGGRWYHAQAVARGEEGRRVERRRWLAIGALVAGATVLAWGPPLAQHLWGDDPSNLRAIVDFLTGAEGAPSEATTYSVPDAAKDLGYALRPLSGWSSWTTTDFFVWPSSRDVVWLAAIVAALGALVWQLGRRGEREARLLVVAALLAVATSYVQLRTLEGPPAIYLIAFLWGVAATTWLALLWGTWRALSDARRAAARPWCLGGAALGACALVVALGLGLADREATTSDALLIDDVAGAVDRTGADPPLDGVVLVEHRGNIGFVPIALSLELEKRGYDIALSGGLRQGLGATRSGRTPDVVLTVVEGLEADRWIEESRRPGATFTLVHERVTPEGEANLAAEREALAALVDCGIEDGHLDLFQHAYAELRVRAEHCTAAVDALDEANVTRQALERSGRWGRYAVFVRDADAAGLPDPHSPEGRRTFP